MANAKSILDVMKTAKLDPSSDTYSKLLCGYAEKGDFENIQAVSAIRHGGNTRVHDCFILE